MAEMIHTADGRYIPVSQWDVEQAQAKAAKQAERAKAAADRRAAKDASKALYEYRIAMWARHKTELAALKAKHTAEVAAMQARHANEAELLKL